MSASKVCAVLVALAVAAGGCGDDGGDSSAFCDRARELEDQVEVDPNNPDPAQFDRTASALEELAAIAPDEIRDEVTTAGQLVREFTDLLASIDVNDPASLEDPQVQQRLEQIRERDTALGPDLEAISQYLEDECGIGAEG